jgi:PAS domain S-box-containing protein
LQNSRSQLQAILDNAPAVVFIKGTDGKYIFVNRMFTEVTVKTRKEIEGHTAAELFPKQIANAAEEHERKILETGSPQQFEETVNYPDGPRTHLAVKFPLRDASGKIYATSGISADISERKRAEEERDRFFTLTRDLLCIANFDGYFIRTNPAWEATFGYSNEEMVSQPFLDFVHPDDLERTTAEAAKLAAGDETISFENRYRCKDGSYRWLLWNARPIVGQKRIYCSARDVTERKRNEEEIGKLNFGIQQRAAQLEVANKELEAFSYSVSHDLRAPLRHIDGFVGLLQKKAGDKLDDSSRRYLEVIAKAAKQMGVLIDDLLVFSRMGRAELSQQKVDMNHLVEEVVNTQKADLNGRHVEWKISPLPTLQADPAMLRQVLVNLVSNAVKYTRPRDPAVIEIGCQSESSLEFLLYVRDNGVGFDMQYAGKLFGVFQRLHHADEFEGTGIGLANVRRIIHRHGGRTWAEGQVGQGATFFYTLPKQPSATSPAL